MTNDYFQERFVFKRDPRNDCLVGPDGCHYETEQEAMFVGQLHICNCGMPENEHAFVCELLQRTNGNILDTKRIETLVANHTAEATTLLLKFLTERNLLEHGSSIYGSWLTDRGKQFVEIGPMT